YTNNRRVKRPNFGRNSALSGPPKKNINTTNQKIEVNFDEIKKQTPEPSKPHVTTTVSPGGHAKKFFDDKSTPFDPHSFDTTVDSETSGATSTPSPPRTVKPTKKPS